MFFALLYLFQLTLVWHQKSYPRITLNSWKPLYCIKLQRWDDESAWERRKYGPGHYALLCFVQGRPWRLVMLYWLLGEKKEVLQWLLAPISCHRNSPIRSHCQSRKALQRLLTNKLPCLGSKLPAFTEDPWKEKKKKIFNSFSCTSSSSQLQHKVPASGPPPSSVVTAVEQNYRGQSMTPPRDAPLSCVSLMSDTEACLQYFFSS